MRKEKEVKVSQRHGRITTTTTSGRADASQSPASAHSRPPREGKENAYLYCEGQPFEGPAGVLGRPPPFRASLGPRSSTRRSESQPLATLMLRVPPAAAATPKCSSSSASSALFSSLDLGDTKTNQAGGFHVSHHPTRSSSSNDDDALLLREKNKVVECSGVEESEISAPGDDRSPSPLNPNTLFKGVRTGPVSYAAAVAALPPAPTGKRVTTVSLPNNNSNNNKKICKQFAIRGTCSFGSRCLYHHDDTVCSGSETRVTVSPTSSSDAETSTMQGVTILTSSPGLLSEDVSLTRSVIGENVLDAGQVTIRGRGSDMDGERDEDSEMPSTSLPHASSPSSHRLTALQHDGSTSKEEMLASTLRSHSPMSSQRATSLPRGCSHQSGKNRDTDTGNSVACLAQMDEVGEESGPTVSPIRSRSGDADRSELCPFFPRDGVMKMNEKEDESSWDSDRLERSFHPQEQERCHSHHQNELFSHPPPGHDAERGGVGHHPLNRGGRGPSLERWCNTSPPSTSPPFSPFTQCGGSAPRVDLDESTTSSDSSGNEADLYHRIRVPAHVDAGIQGGCPAEAVQQPLDSLFAIRTGAIDHGTEKVTAETSTTSSHRSGIPSVSSELRIPISVPKVSAAAAATVVITPDNGSAPLAGAPFPAALGVGSHVPYPYPYPYTHHPYSAAASPFMLPSPAVFYPSSLAPPTGMGMMAAAGLPHPNVAWTSPCNPLTATTPTPYSLDLPGTTSTATSERPPSCAVPPVDSGRTGVEGDDISFGDAHAQHASPVETGGQPHATVCGAPLTAFFTSPPVPNPVLAADGWYAPHARLHMPTPTATTMTMSPRLLPAAATAVSTPPSSPTLAAFGWGSRRVSPVDVPAAAAATTIGENGKPPASSVWRPVTSPTLFPGYLTGHDADMVPPGLPSSSTGPFMNEKQTRSPRSMGADGRSTPYTVTTTTTTTTMTAAHPMYSSPEWNRGDDAVAVVTGREVQGVPDGNCDYHHLSSDGLRVSPPVFPLTLPCGVITGGIPMPPLSLYSVFPFQTPLSPNVPLEYAREWGGGGGATYPFLWPHAPMASSYSAETPVLIPSANASSPVDAASSSFSWYSNGRDDPFTAVPIER